MKIEYLSGHDVREPIGEGRRIIGHCCNSEGKMGAGVALALLQKWPIVRTDYVNWHKTNNYVGQPFALGKTQLLLVEEDIAVANIIGQHGLRINKKTGEVPVRYSALREGCAYVAKACSKFNATANFPYLMGCDLAGGNWEEVEKILQEELIDQGIQVFVYDLFKKRGEKEV